MNEPKPMVSIPNAAELKEKIKGLLAAKGFRKPEYVARYLNIKVETARALMFDGSGTEDPDFPCIER